MGKRIGSIVGKRLGKTILELGGNNGIIVDKQADMNLVVPAIVFGAVGTAGQRCTSTRRIFVHSSQSEQIAERLINAYKQVTIGDPLDSKTLMGPLIDNSAVNDYLSAIDKAKSEGATVLYGGNILDKEGFLLNQQSLKQKIH